MIPRWARVLFARTGLQVLACVGLCFGLLISNSAVAGPPTSERKVEVRTDAAPDWVRPLAGHSHQVGEAVGGYAYDDFDTQVRVRGNRVWRYTHARERITSEAGLTGAGERTFDFSAPDEELHLHTLAVWREGVRVSTLDPGEIELLQRESGLENQTYSGLQTAMIVLSDLRVGDVIEYAYSLVEEKPVFAGHYSDWFSLEYSQPVARHRVRVLSDRELKVRRHAGAGEPEFKRVGKGENEGYEYLWEAQDVEAVRAEGETPVEFQSYASVQVSDFDDWGQVAQWGARLFEVPERLPDALQPIVDDIRTRPGGLDAQVAAALRKVQDEIRYFSIAFSESTHRPANPGEVMARRYGDCKDKTLLALTLIRALGVEAYPVLVRSDGGALLAQSLPSALVFDHVVVVVELDGTRYWLDPTLLYQRGSLRHMATRDFSFGLPLHEASQGLIAFDPESDATLSRDHADMEMRLSYVSKNYQEPGALDLELVFRGGRAEGMRSLIASSTREDLEPTIKSWIELKHPKAVAEGEPVLEDDEVANVVSVSQHFALPELWTQPHSGRYETVVSAFLMSKRLPGVGDDREDPIAFEYPSHIVHHIELEMPDVFDIEPTHEVFECSVFRASFDARVEGEKVYLDYDYRAKKRRIEVDEFESYTEAINRMNEWQDYALWYDEPVVPAEGGTFNWMIFAAGAVWVLLLLIAAGFILHFQPSLPTRVEYDPDLAGIRNGLAVLGLLLLFGPFAMVTDLRADIGVYGVESFAALTTPGLESYDPLWAPALLFSLFSKLSSTVLAFFLLLLFFNKMRAFPLVYVSSRLIVLASYFIDSWFTAHIPSIAAENSRSGAEDLGMLVGAVLVCWYVLRSRRVRATFLPPRDEQAVAPGVAC